MSDSVSCPTHLFEAANGDDALKAGGRNPGWSRSSSKGPAASNESELVMSKKQSGKKQSQGTYNPKDLAASAAFVEKASQPFADVTRLEPDEKRRMLRSKRGAREVIAMIADLAVKYGVVAPGVTPDTMTAMSNQARALEPLLATVSALYELV